MKVWNITEDEIRASAAEVGVKIYGEWSGYGNGIWKDGRALRFRLGVDTAQQRGENGELPYQRTTMYPRGPKPRRVAAVCWHGHRDFMRALFRRNPEARIKTALADYRGASDFTRKFADTYGKGNGYNLDYGQACVCSEAVREDWEDWESAQSGYAMQYH